jgi:hypothetical protein
VATEIKPDEGARQFAAAEHPMLIGADWVEAADGRTFDVYDPSTGDVLGRVARGAAPRTSTAPSRPPAPPSTRGRGTR